MWPNSCLISCRYLIDKPAMNAVPLDPLFLRSRAASQERHVWRIRLLTILLLGLAGLLWLAAPVTAVTPLADPACVASVQSCADGTSGTSTLAGLDADHGDLADLDVHCAQTPVVQMPRTRHWPGSEAVAAVSGVQPWLPPPRCQA